MKGMHKEKEEGKIKRGKKERTAIGGEILLGRRKLWSEVEMREMMMIIVKLSMETVEKYSH